MKVTKKFEILIVTILVINTIFIFWNAPNTKSLENIGVNELLGTKRMENPEEIEELPKVKEILKNKISNNENFVKLPAKGFAQSRVIEEREKLQSGFSGNVEWAFYDDLTLEFAGGTLGNYDDDYPNEHSFSYLASDVKKVVFTEAVKIPVDGSAIFRDFIILEEIQGLELLDTSSTMSIKEMFRNTKSLKEVDLSSFDTSKVLTMHRLFDGSGVEKINISSFNTSETLDMSLMFYELKIKELDISHFDLREVLDLRYAFAEMTELEVLDLSKVQTTSKLEIASGMFQSMYKVSKLDLRGFDVSNVENCILMFSQMRNLSELDISTWDLSSADDFTNMFLETVKLENLDLSHIRAPKVKKLSGMFLDSAIKEVDLRNLETPFLEEFHVMFKGAKNLEKVNISKLDSRNILVKNGYAAVFSGADKLSEIVLGPNARLYTPYEDSEGGGLLHSVGLTEITEDQNPELTGGWIGINTQKRYSSSKEFTKNYNGDFPDTYVREKHLEVITAEDFVISEKDLATADFIALAKASAYDVETREPVQVIMESEMPTQAGIYDIVLKTITEKRTKTIKVEVTKDEPPVITTPQSTILQIGDNFDPLNEVQAIDKEDGDISSLIKITENTVDTSNDGLYKVKYQVSDSFGNLSETTRNVFVINSNYAIGENYILKASNFSIEESEVDASEEGMLRSAQAQVFNKNTFEEIPVNNLTGLTDGITLSATSTSYGEFAGLHIIKITIPGETIERRVRASVTSAVIGENTQPFFVGDQFTQINVNDEFNPLEGIQAFDNEDGEITNSIEIVENNVNTSVAGMYKVEYFVMDSEGLYNTFTRNVLVSDGTYVVGENYILKASNFSIEESEVDASEEGMLRSAQAQVFNKNTFEEIPVNNLTGLTDGITLSATSTSYGEFAGLHIIKITIPGETIERRVRASVTSAVIGENTQPFFVGDQFTQINVNDKFNPLEGIQAFDNEDGEITNSIEIVENNVNTSVAGMYKVEYFVMDSEGLYNTFTRNVLVSDGTYVVGENYILKAEDFSVRLNSIDTTNAGIIKSAKVSVFDKNTGEEVIITSLARITSVDLTIDKGGFSSKVGDYTIKIMLTEDPLASKNVNATVLDNIQKPTIDQGYIGATSVTGTGIAGNTIKVMLTDGTSFNTVVNSNNKWKIILNNPLKKDDKITAVQINQSNEMSDSVVMTVTSYLEVPIINKPATGDTSISGTGTPGSSIEVVLPDGTTVETTVDENGNWTINVPPLNTGDKIEIIQENNGAVSEKVEIVIDKEITPTINQPYTGDKVLTGTGTPGSVVEITLPDGTTVETTVDENGNWQLNLENSLEENQEISIVYVYPNGVKSDSFKIKVINKNSGETPSNDSSDSLVETGTKNEINTQIGLLISFIILLVIRKTKNTQKQ